MARPRINPLIRYSFEIDMWQLALARGSSGYTCESPKKAIHLTHKLNMARAAIREQSANQYVDWDLFVARQNGCQVIITRKDELDVTKITDADGNPLTAEDWNKAAETPIQVEDRPRAAKFHQENVTTKLGSKPPPPETFDPNAPLGLDITK
jgi:hypothetical protein